jgi:hypothetical protein
MARKFIRECAGNVHGHLLAKRLNYYLVTNLMDNKQALAWISHYVGNQLMKLPMHYDLGDLKGVERVKSTLIEKLESLDKHPYFNEVIAKLKEESWESREVFDNFREWYSKWEENAK